MSINWYPGHMHKANKEIRKVIPNVDIVIEVLDARIPYSSENPEIKKLRRDKPSIKILNKSDLADPKMTQAWQQSLEREQGVKALALTTEQPDQIQKITDICREMLPSKEQGVKNINAMIMGIPNVGKSTLINTLAGRVIAVTGNQPAVTKSQQRINLRNGIVLFDTPGILWPKVENENSGYRLAATGAIKDTAMTYEDVAFFTADYLLNAYPDFLKERFQLEELPNTEIDFFEMIGAQRGCLRSGGKVDLEKISKIFINEYRSGMLGRITLETPEIVAKEKVIVEIIMAEKAEKKAARKERFKKGR